MLASPAPHVARATPPHTPAAPAQPAILAPPPAPVVAPELAAFVVNFKDTVTSQIRARVTSAPEAIALSVVNRGLGLMAHSLAPIIILLPPGREREDELRRVETIEKVVLAVFETSRAQQEQKLARGLLQLGPALLDALAAFKTRWVRTLEPKLGRARGEAMVMSAVDRALGFVDHSVFQIEEAQRREYENAEAMLVRALAKDLHDCARALPRPPPTLAAPAPPRVPVPAARPARPSPPTAPPAPHAPHVPVPSAAAAAGAGAGAAAATERQVEAPAARPVPDAVEGTAAGSASA